MNDQFKCEVKESRSRSGGFDLSITHNGYQWTIIRIGDKEWPEVVRAVNEFRKTHRRRQK